MSEAVESYLDRVMTYANRRDEADAARVRAELKDHLLAKVERLERDGVPREDAVFRAVESHGDPRMVGYALRPAFPLIDVRTHGTARGVIAIGPRAVGVFAYGGAAVGVFAFGGMSVSIVGMGGLTLSLLFAWGGLAMAPLGLAYGGVALGLLAIGGLGLGLFVPSGLGHALLPSESLPESLQFLEEVTRSASFYQAASAVMLVIMFCVMAGATFLAAREKQRTQGTWRGKLLRPD